MWMSQHWLLKVRKLISFMNKLFFGEIALPLLRGVYKTDVYVIWPMTLH